eukprot:maker-scaffold20_size707684-snap-gene-3.14 protein:Tk03843 transcript:maker-scaffold20_size707684-snap-gene-3.14-mRNA-1 annotation:"hypothetical protein CAPTEDRAFT_157160"
MNHPNNMLETLYEAEIEDLDFDYPNFILNYSTREAWEGLNERLDNTRSQRVRLALFPDTLDPSAAENIPPVRIDPCVQSALETLAEPAQAIREAIKDLLEYTHDVDLALNFVPKIAELLSDNDPTVIRNALELIQDLSLSEAPCRAVMNSPQLVGEMIRVLGSLGDSRNDERAKEAGSGTLLNLSRYENGRRLIFKTGGIAFLVKLLASPAKSVVFFATQALHNLLAFQPGTKMAIITEGGIQKMVPLLQLRDPKFLAVLMDCLQMISFQDSESKLAVNNCDGPTLLLGIIKKGYFNDKVMLATSRLLKVLSTCLYTKETLAENGGFFILVKRLSNTRDEKIFKNYLTILRNISDADANFYIDQSVINEILKLLQSEDPEIVDVSAGILGNLTSERPSKKMAVYECGGVEIILKTLLVPRKSSTLAGLMLALRHMTARHRMGKDIRAEIRKLGGVELSIQFLLTSNEWETLKPILGLIRNLANMKVNHKIMEELQVATRLAEILSHAVKSLEVSRRNRNMEKNEGDYDNIPTTIVDGVDLEDAIIDCIGSLALLAHQPSIRKLIIHLNMLDLIERLGEVEGEEIRMVAMEFMDIFNEGFNDQEYDRRHSTRSLEGRMVNTTLDDPGFEIVDEPVVGNPEAIYENTTPMSTLERTIVVNNDDGRPARPFVRGTMSSASSFTSVNKPVVGNPAEAIYQNTTPMSTLGREIVVANDDGSLVGLYVRGTMSSASSFTSVNNSNMGTMDFRRGQSYKLSKKIDFTDTIV